MHMIQLSIHKKSRASTQQVWLSISTCATAIIGMWVRAILEKHIERIYPRALATEAASKTLIKKQQNY